MIYAEFIEMDDLKGIHHYDGSVTVTEGNPFTLKTGYAERRFWKSRGHFIYRNIALHYTLLINLTLNPKPNSLLM